MIPTKQGGATRRPGTQLMGIGKQISPGVGTSRLENFQFAPGTAFILEFCHKGIRFYSNGAQVMVPSAPAWITGTSYAWGAFVTSGGKTYYAFSGPVINSTTAPASDPSNWVSQTIYEVPSPYSGINYVAPNFWAADVFVLQAKQINDVVYIVHPNYPVWKLTRYSDTNWVMQQVQFLTPAMLDQNPGDSTIAASATTGTGVSLQVSAAAWTTATRYEPGNSVLVGSLIYNATAIHISSAAFTTDLANGLWAVEFTFQAGHVGSYWQLAYNRPSSYVEQAIDSNTTSGTIQVVGKYTVATYGTWSADLTLQVSYDNGVTWQVVFTRTSRADSNYNEAGQELSGGLYRIVITNWTTETSSTPPRVTLTASNQFVYGLVLITAVTNSYQAACNVIVPLFDTTATTFWSEGAWSDVRGYPQSVTIFQERAWYGGTVFQPQRVWGTQTDDIENFALIDNSEPSYGLAFDLNAPGRGPIQWLNAQTDLFAGLAGAEWIISSGQPNVAITPTQVIAVEHSVNGSAAALPGLIIGNACFYVQRKGTSFQQMMFSVFTNKYMSQDMQVLSQHLTAARVKQFDFQQQFQNQSLLWAVCGDGSLISLTYAMDQEVFGWAKHTTGDGKDFGFLSVQVIYGASGQDDEVWVSTSRGTSTNIERINPADWQTANRGAPDLSQAFYADSAISVTSPGSNVIGGLPPVLFGRTACAFIFINTGPAGAVAVNNLLISNTGTVTIPNYVPVAGDVVVVGLPINWAVQPMRLDIDPRAGPTPGITKSISKLFVRMLNSIGGTWATKQGELTPFPDYKITQNSGLPPAFVAGVPVEVEIDVGGLMQYDVDPQFIIQGSDPLPFTLLGIAIKSDIGGAP